MSRNVLLQNNYYMKKKPQKITLKHFKKEQMITRNELSKSRIYISGYGLNFITSTTYQRYMAKCPFSPLFLNKWLKFLAA